MDNKVPMTALILAGGKSSRMGRDKALLPFGESTVLEYLTRLTAPVFGETFILAASQYPYKELDLHGASVLTDFWEHRGPLAGLYTGLSYSTHPVCCVLSCDMPLVHAAFFHELAAAWQEGDDAVCLKDAAGRWQPFPALYHRSTRYFIRRLLERNEISMRRFLEILNIRRFILGIDKMQVLTNMNTPADYEQVLEILKTGGTYAVPGIVAS